MKQDEADVQKLLSVFTSELMRNPFTLPNYDDDECLPLVNIATGVVMPRELSAKLLQSVIIGTEKRFLIVMTGERAQRGASVALDVNISSASMPLPRQWDKYISNPVNKANLVLFLSEQWCDFGTKKLPFGKTVLLAGCFKDGMDVVAISHGKLQDVECL